MKAIFSFIKRNAVFVLIVALAITVAIGVVSAKYVYDGTVANDLKLTIVKGGAEYTIDKTKMHTALRALSPKPKTLKFVKGNEVPATATLVTAEGIQTEGSGTIGVYKATDNTTVYIAPTDSNTAVMYAPENCYNFLNGYSNVTNLGNTLTTLDLKNLDTSRVTDMSYMFTSLSALTSIDLSGFNTARVTNMEWMFYHSYRLPSLDLRSFNTARVTNMSFMFYYNPALTTITVGGGFDVSAVTNDLYMFYYCPQLKGGAGTTYSYSHIDKTYARIDGGPDSATPGYFTGA